MKDEISLVRKLRNIIAELESIVGELESNSLSKTECFNSGCSEKTSLVQSENSTTFSSGDEAQVYLSNKGIKITGVNNSTGELKTEAISLYMGSKYDLVKDFISSIKSNQPFGRSFHMNLSKYSQLEISSICQLADILHKSAFLESYRYRNSPCFDLGAKTTSNPAIMNYFAGAWLEEYVSLTLKKIIESDFADTITISMLHNPQIQFSNIDNFELDLFSVINGKYPLWIESKSGDYQRHLIKYSSLLEILGVPRGNFILVLSNMSEAAAQNLGNVHNLNIANCEILGETISKVLSSILSEG